jgi:hypothetical protein
MGYLGYAFVPLTPGQIDARRVSLDSHARAAQLSQVAVLVALPCIRLLQLALFNPRQAKLVRRWQWRFQSEVADGWGSWAAWTYGLAWALGLGFLCVHDTAPGRRVPMISG